MIYNSLETKLAKPFLKWAGGKTQLLPELEMRFPQELKDGKINKYIEPFVGSGALLFYLVQNYKIEEAYIFDINPELINVYTVIKQDVNDLIETLEEKESVFLPLDKENRKQFYYEQRDSFNRELSSFDFNSYSKENVHRAAQFIFLNKTCFNGLYRVNKKGLFNVPMGNYKKPTICNKENLLAVSAILQRINIKHGDYKESLKYVTKDTFLYFDPPYRPLNTSSSFTAYSKYDFTDKEQVELATYFEELHNIGAKLMLSNSDPKNVDPEDNFFDELYKDFYIDRVGARRSINSKGSSRGQINEILVTNYMV